MKKLRLFEDVGLVLIDDPKWAIGYGVGHGFLRWLPNSVKGAIGGVWNKVACSLRGHDQIAVDLFLEHVCLGSPQCHYCCSPLKVNGKYPTQEEIDANDILVYEKDKQLYGDLVEDEPLSF